jgi:hypothetical protein
MSTSAIVIIAIAVVVLVALAVLLTQRRRSDRLRSRFGPEYERTVQVADHRRDAEAELRARQKRVERFEIRPLSPSDQARFVAAWRDVQAEFVDRPKEALARADDLLTEVMRVRGYPVGDFEQRSADLSVDHAEVVQNYRSGREIAQRHKSGQAGTEDLRQAMIHYRALFDELVGESGAAEARRAS